METPAKPLTKIGMSVRSFCRWDRGYLRRLISCAKKICMHLVILFYVTLLYDPATGPQPVDASVSPPRKRKLKTKLSQTGGQTSKKVRQKIDKFYTLTNAFRKTRLLLRGRFRRTVLKYYTKEKAILEKAETIQNDLQSTNAEIQRTGRDVIVLGNCVEVLTQKLKDAKVGNQLLVSRLQTVRDDLKMIDRVSSGIYPFPVQ